jgi:hypothetical protein
MLPFAVLARMGVRRCSWARSSHYSPAVDEGRILLRSHINATIGFPALAEVTGKNAKSLMRMLGPEAIRLLTTFSTSSGALGARKA